MTVCGTNNPEWLRLYRFAVENKAISRDTAKETLFHGQIVLTWWKKGKDIDVVYALHEGENIPAYAVIA